MAIPHKEGKYSYADYLTWGEGERIELIGGNIINMSPAPSRRHQQVLRELSTAFSNFLSGKKCEVFFSPFDVRLLADNKQNEEIKNVVQPDLSIICDPNKPDEQGCNGAPDFIAEVLSPSSIKVDRWTKFQLYERADVKEYWLVDPINEAIEIYRSTKGRYKFQGVFTKEDTISVHFLTGLEINLQSIFE